MAKPVNRHARKTHVLQIRVTFDKPMTKGQAKTAASYCLSGEYYCYSPDHPAERFNVRSVTTIPGEG